MIKNCLRCQKGFITYPSRVNTKYCSNNCKNPIIIKICLTCKKEFRISPSRNFKTKYCSQKCHSIGRVTHINMTCPQCLKVFYAFKSDLERSKRITCSRKCSDKFFISTYTELREYIRGLWFYSEWKRKIKERDNFTCQICGRKPLTKNEIHADHITPLAHIVYNKNINTVKEARECKELWDINNGRTLCIECHKKTDTWGANTRYQQI